MFHMDYFDFYIKVNYLNQWFSRTIGKLWLGTVSLIDTILAGLWTLLKG